MPRIVTSRWRRAAVPAALAMAVVSTTAMRLPGGAWAANGAAGAPIFLPLTARGFDLSDRPPATRIRP